MNHCTNELGERIEAIGAENSHIRMKSVYCVTMPKLLTFMFNRWSEKSYIYIGDMFDKMEDFKVKEEHKGFLYSALLFYHNCEIGNVDLEIID